MGEFTVSDQVVTFEQVSAEDAERSFVLVVEYGHEYVDRTSTERIPLEVSRRRAVTRDLVRETLAEWAEASGATIRSYEVLEEVECRRGDLVRVEGEASTPDLPPDKPVPGVDPRSLTPGDRVAYYVGGPGDDVYGHLSEGIVEDVPPWNRSPQRPDETVTDAVRLDVGGRVKEIPLGWIVGPSDDAEVAEAIDRPRDSIGE